MSDSPKGVKIRFDTKDFPTVKLTKEFLEDLLNIVYKEYETRQEANVNFRIVVVEKTVNRAYVYTHKDDFLKEYNYFLKRFVNLTIKLENPLRNILIDIWNYKNKKSKYSVTSDNEEWSGKIEYKMAKILEKHQTGYNFLHSRKSWIMWGVAGFLITLGYMYFQPSQPITDKLIQITVSTWSIAYWSSYFIRWLFPRIEIENTIPVKFRSWLLTGLIGGVVIGVILKLLLH